MFQGILRAALRVQKITLRMRNPILGMASHNLCTAKTIILGATPGAIPGIDGTHMEIVHLPMNSRSVFSRIGAVPARQRNDYTNNSELHRGRTASRSLKAHLNMPLIVPLKAHLKVPLLACPFRSPPLAAWERKNAHKLFFAQGLADRGGLAGGTPFHARDSGPF